MIYGDVRTYGGRTAAGPDDDRWLWFANSREVMAVAHEADAIAQNYVLRQIDGRRQLFASLETDLRAMLLRHFNLGALYGATPPEAFQVDTGTMVNTTETIAAGEIHAVIRIKTSPTSEWVEVAIVKVPLEVPIAA
jgi:phage tail sheath protein FI